MCLDTNIVEMEKTNNNIFSSMPDTTEKKKDGNNVGIKEKDDGLKVVDDGIKFMASAAAAPGGLEIKLQLTLTVDIYGLLMKKIHKRKSE